MFGLKSMCLCILRIIIRKDKQTKNQLGNQENEQPEKQLGNQPTNQDNDQQGQDVPITKLVRQFAECNYPK